MIGCRLQQWEIEPAEKLQLGLASHLTRANRQRSTSQIQKQVTIEANAIFEEHVVEVEVLFQSDGGFLALQTVHRGKYRLNQPQHLAPMHDVLVDEELVAFIERLRGFSDDDGVKGREGLHFLFFILGTVNQSVNLSVNLNTANVVVLRQSLGDVIHILLA